MANVPISNMTVTWTDSGTTYTAVKMNVTDTASNAASLLMDLQVGGVSAFRVTKSGQITAIASASTYMFQADTATWAWSAAGFGGTAQAAIKAGSFQVANTGFFSFSSSSNANGTQDTILVRDAADTLAQRRATNPQAFRVYNTYTDASNYERGFIRYASNQLEIGHEVAGTGNGDRLIVIQRPNAGTVLDIKGSTTVAARIGTGVSGFGTAIGVGANGTNPDVFVYRRATAIASLTGNATGTTGAALEFTEQTAPAAPATNGVYIYAQDNGAGKTQLMARFATGAAVQIAIEP